MERYKLSSDSIANIDKVYTIVGKTGNGYGRNRYVQHNPESDRPMIVTFTGYTSRNVIVFTNRIAAENFLGNFLSSKSRRQQYNIDWEIIQYKPYGYKSRLREYELISKFDREYGYYYKLKLIKTEYLEEEEKMSFDTKFVELENKLLSLNNAVYELKDAVKNTQHKFNLEDYLDSLEHGSDDIDTILKYVVDNFDVTDVYSEDDIEDAMKNNSYLDISELFTDDEIIDYVQNNLYPEDLVSIDWR